MARENEEEEEEEEERGGREGGVYPWAARCLATTLPW